MNVVVVIANGLGCHWLGPYGNAWVSTQALDGLAAQSVVFDRHFADEPSAAGTRNICSIDILRGLQSHAVTAAMVDDRKARTGDDSQWDFVEASEPSKYATPGDALVSAFDLALKRLKSRSPWLLWIETDQLVPPWDFEFETYQEYAATSGGFADDEEKAGDAAEPIDNPPAGAFIPDDDRHWHQLHNSFAAAVTAFDGVLAGLLNIIRKRDLEESTAVILTAGYGWPLGEHGIVGPDHSRMHEELVHIPLIVQLPTAQRETRRVSAFTQAFDLGPTLLDLFGRPLTGPSLVPLMTGTRIPWRESAQSSLGAERMIRTDEWAFLPAHPPRLYRKPDDIWEVNDIAAAHVDECDRLAALFKEPTP
jgi:arylsulfatase A-like enzyme